MPRSSATEALLLGLLLGWLLAGGRGCERTYYPIMICRDLCDDYGVNAFGHPHKRFALALPPETYTALREQQDVIRKTSVLVESLTKDRKFQCRIQDDRNWACERKEEGSIVPLESYTVDSGTLTYTDFEEAHRRSPPGVPTHWLVYGSWCDWHQVDWHNDTTDSDDRVPTNFDSGWVAALIYFATGCRI